jgi:hypothetical protein
MAKIASCGCHLRAVAGVGSFDPWGWRILAATTEQRKFEDLDSLLVCKAKLFLEKWVPSAITVFFIRVLYL